MTVAEGNIRDSHPTNLCGDHADFGRPSPQIATSDLPMMAARIQQLEVGGLENITFNGSMNHRSVAAMAAAEVPASMLLPSSLAAAVCVGSSIFVAVCVRRHDRNYRSIDETDLTGEDD